MIQLIKVFWILLMYSEAFNFILQNATDSTIRDPIKRRALYQCISLFDSLNLILKHIRMYMKMCVPYWKRIKASQIWMLCTKFKLVIDKLDSFSIYHLKKFNTIFQFLNWIMEKGFRDFLFSTKGSISPTLLYE